MGTRTSQGQTGCPCTQAVLEETGLADMILDVIQHYLTRSLPRFLKAIAEKLTPFYTSNRYLSLNTNGTTILSCTNVLYLRPVSFNQLGTCSGHQRRTFHKKIGICLEWTEAPKGVVPDTCTITRICLITKLCCGRLEWEV